jgi:WS/DGAT/MGAT family acyltransferase
LHIAVVRATIVAVAASDRLTGLDSAFLHLERDSAHMHVASCMIFEGEPPGYDDFVAHLSGRLHLVPRYRQKLAFVPLSQGRPRWVDDPHFQPQFHVRHTALPSPGGEQELKALCGRVFAQELDRSKPLWEIWLVEGLRRGGFALLAKTHHCLVDGVSGVDITTVLFDAAPDPAPVPAPATPWLPRPEPSPMQLLGEALVERATLPREIVRGARALVRGPRQVAGALRDNLVAAGAFTWAGFNGAPPTPLNVPIGPHRRFAWVNADLERFKAIKNALGGTINDVVLSAVTLALGAFLRDRGHDTEELVLKAMVPVSVRADAERGALGNRVAAMWAPLPVYEHDAGACFAFIHEAMAGLKDSGQAVGAQVITELTGFAPPTIMAQAARLQVRQRFFNLTVTNIPGPQTDLYLMGSRLQAIEPMVPLAKNTALGIAILSYAGTLGFGLVSDLDAVPDVDLVAAHLKDAIDALAAAAGVPQQPSRGGATRSATSAPSTAATAPGNGGAATGVPSETPEPLHPQRLSSHRRRRPGTRPAGAAPRN